MICIRSVFFEPFTVWSGVFNIFFSFYLCVRFFTRRRIVHPICRVNVVGIRVFVSLYSRLHRNIWYLMSLFCFGLDITFGCFWNRSCSFTIYSDFLKIWRIFLIVWVFGSPFISRWWNSFRSFFFGFFSHLVRWIRFRGKWVCIILDRFYSVHNIFQWCCSRQMVFCTWSFQIISVILTRNFCFILDIHFGSRRVCCTIPRLVRVLVLSRSLSTLCSGFYLIPISLFGCGRILFFNFWSRIYFCIPLWSVRPEVNFVILIFRCGLRCCCIIGILGSGRVCVTVIFGGWRVCWRRFGIVCLTICSIFLIRLIRCCIGRLVVLVNLPSSGW